MMKLAIALVVLVAAVAALEPRHIDPKIPFPNSVAPGSRITNGEVAKVGQFPYQAGLMLKLPDGRGAWCGGSLISDRVVVTAAHCADGIASVDVLLGAANRLENEPNQQVVTVGKSGIIVHEGWNPSTLANDIALIKFPAPIKFNADVQPILLARNVPSMTYGNDASIASGWGKDSDKATSVSPVLRYIEVPIMPNNLCNRYYFGSIQSTHICIVTGAEHKSTCNGDSGGPLVVNENGQRVLVGATSFGIAAGCEVGWPGVFTRISSYLEWINKNTGIPIRP